ncbi:hypothetical protein PS943_03652 [Pseudomonas fluorescens]|uniref:Uncharacterized protein n=1 Tax=Pseudomonas fluorescens TaxID=294 RepID=A0A5E7WFW7_PSEFL|nr:hypothetical protein PS943_03652 [Pseudomonas fluorescens]
MLESDRITYSLSFVTITINENTGCFSEILRHSHLYSSFVALLKFD